MSTSDNKEAIRRIYQAMSEGDRSVFGASVHPDYVWRLPGHGSWSRRFEGQQAIREQLLAPLFALFAGEYKAHAINLVAEGDFVVAEVRGDVATQRGERYQNEYCFVFRFRDGLIAEVVEYCDTEHLELRLGNYDAAVTALQPREGNGASTGQAR